MSQSSLRLLTARQIKAARALLDWSQDDLANATSLSIATIRRIELGTISPRNATADEIRRAFEDAGLEFIEPGGVRQRPEDIMIYQGPEGARAFFDDVYETTKNKGCETVIIHPSPKKFFLDILGDYSKIHIERMTKLGQKSSVRCIVTDDKSLLPATAYCEYRWIPKQYVNAAPCYVYDNKYAIIILELQPSPKIVVIQSKAASDAFRHQFYSMWDKAKPLNKITTFGNQPSKVAR